MKPFTHHNARTVEEAVLLLRRYDGKAKLIAGGTDLVGVLKDRILPDYPQALVNLKTVAGLSAIADSADGLRIGALAKLADITESPIVNERYPLVAQAARATAFPQLRNMATIGGNLCQENRCLYYRYPHQLGGRVLCLRKGGTVCHTVAGDNRHDSIFGAPNGCYAVCLSDMAPALIAMGATAVTTRRKVPLEGFFTPLPGNVLDSDEVLMEIQVPPPMRGTKGTYLKFSLRKAIDFAVVSVACAMVLEDGLCREARIVLGGVAPTPWRATSAEGVIKGRGVDSGTAEEAGRSAVANAAPRPMNKHKVALAEVLVKRAILALCA